MRAILSDIETKGAEKKYSDFAYDKEGYYYIGHGDAGLVSYEAEVVKYEQTEDGLYNIDVLCKPSECNDDGYESEEIAINAGLKYINGIKQWTFFEIDGMDFEEPEVTEPEKEEPSKAENPEPVTGTPSDVVNKFTGSWYDLYSSRCGMEISYDQGSDMFYISITWGSAYNEAARWSFKGKYDSSINGINYTGEHYNEIFDDSGNGTKEYHYTNGSGKIYFKSDGYIYWQDNIEGAGDSCYFDRG